MEDQELITKFLNGTVKADAPPKEALHVPVDTSQATLTPNSELIKQFVGEDLPELPPESKPPSSWEDFQYQWKKAGSFGRHWGGWLESRFPLGNLEINIIPDANKSLLKYTSPEELYGPDFYSLSPDKRLERIRATRDVELAAAHPEAAERKATDSVAGAIGYGSGLLSDPVVLTPIGQKYKTMAALGGLTAAADMSAYDLYHEGHINWLNTGVAGLGGAILTPAAIFSGRAIKGYIRELTDKFTSKSAEKIISSFETKVTEAVAKGTAPRQAVLETMEALKINDDILATAMRHADRPTFIPTDREMAAEILTNTIPVGSRQFKEGGWLDDLIEPISARIEKISQGVYGSVMRYEYNIASRVHNLVEPAKPFFKAIKSLDTDNEKLAIKAWNNNDLKTLERVFKDTPEALEALKFMRKTFDKFIPELKKMGYKDFRELPNYLPRLVADYKGLLNKLGSEPRSRVSNALRKAGKDLGRPLDEYEKARIVGKALRGYPRDLGTLKSTKARTFEGTVPEELLPYYASPENAYHAYITKTVHNLEKRALFGRHLAVKKANITAVDMQKTIANYIGSQENLSEAALTELQKLIEARFLAGEAPMNRFMQGIKNWSYVATLTQATPSITQLTDIGVVAHRFGITNAIKSVVNSIRGAHHLKAVDLGVTAASEELAFVNSLSARVLEKTLKWSGFTAFDRFGKTVAINAAFEKFTKMSLKEKGINKIASKYSKMFQDDFALLINDLKNKQITERTKLLLFTELSRMQPISKSEMPLAYLTGGSPTRLLYMLKSFTLKQMNVFREDVLREYAKGNIFTATKNLTTFTLYFGMAGLGADSLKSYILGRELHPEDMPDQFMYNMLKNFMASEYIINKSKEGDWAAFIKNTAQIPLLNVIADIGRDYKHIMKKDKASFSLTPKQKHAYKSLRYIPIAGAFTYNYFGGGLERANEQRRKKQAEKQFKFKSAL